MLQSLSDAANALQAVRIATLLKGDPSIGVSEPVVCRSSTK